jgi:hypothetical protein
MILGEHKQTPDDPEMIISLRASRKSHSGMEEDVFSYRIMH